MTGWRRNGSPKRPRLLWQWMSSTAQPCCYASSCFGQPGRPYQGSRLSLSIWIRHGSGQPLVPPGRLFDERSAALLSTEVQGLLSADATNDDRKDRSARCTRRGTIASCGPGTLSPLTATLRRIYIARARARECNGEQARGRGGDMVPDCNRGAGDAGSSDPWAGVGDHPANSSLRRSARRPAAFKISSSSSMAVAASMRAFQSGLRCNGGKAIPIACRSFSGSVSSQAVISGERGSVIA
jgi:hypothetical protein